VNLRIELRRSRRVIALILFSHLGALTIVPWLDIAMMWHILLGIAILASLSLQWRKHIQPGAHAIIAVQVSDDGEWSLRRADATQDEPARLLSHFVHPFAIVARLKTERGRVEPVILTRDTQDAEILRQLRVRLSALRRDKQGMRS
jgi:hypothetical protein